MADEILALKGEGNVDVQIGGPGNPWIYLSACASMSGPTVPHGGTEIRWCQDPKKAGGFKKSSRIRTAPDQVSFDLMTKLGKIDYLDGLDCSFTLRARYAKCGERENPGNYDPLMLSYCNSEIQEHSYDDLVIVDPGDNDEILVTAPIQADDEYRIKFISPTRLGSGMTDLGDQAINDVEYCDTASCGGYCGARSDGCARIYGVTDADATPYTNPNLVKGVINQVTDLITWSVAPILGLNNNVEGLECTGDRLIVSSNGDSAVAWNASDGDQDEWNVVVLALAPSPFHAALHMRTAREGYLGAASGYIYKTVDGGTTWNAVAKGETTNQRINAVYAYDKDLVYVAGNNGVILKSRNGGQSWDDITEVSTVASNLLRIIVPPGRPKEVYIGANNGKIYRSTDEGGTFSALSFDGDGVGSVDDIDFCGPCGSDVMFILHNDGGPRGRILRDLSGGAGGADIEIVSGYFDVIQAGVDLNALACCGVNEVVSAGELSGGYPVIIRAN
ncbi:MAG: WD40/YVTN/BNR-like repeat-containing protein [Nitrospiria bacterium]